MLNLLVISFFKNSLKMSNYPNSANFQSNSLNLDACNGQKSIENLHQLCGMIQTNREQFFAVMKNILNTLNVQINTIKELKEESMDQRKSNALTKIEKDNLQKKLDEERWNNEQQFELMSKKASKLINQIKTELYQSSIDERTIENIIHLLNLLNNVFSSTNDNTISSLDNLDDLDENLNLKNNVKQSTSQDGDGHPSLVSESNEPITEHQMEYLLNRLRFLKCDWCNCSIRPLQYYYQCNLCNIKLDKNCLKFSPCCNKQSETLNTDGNSTPIISSVKLKLDQYFINLMEQCLYNIEYKHMNGKDERCYSIKRKHMKDANQKLNKLFIAINNKSTNGDFLKINQTNNVNNLCAFVINLIISLNDSIIPSHLWNDFSKACTGMCGLLIISIIIMYFH